MKKKNVLTLTLMERIEDNKAIVNNFNSLDDSTSDSHYNVIRQLDFRREKEELNWKLLIMT